MRQEQIKFAFSDQPINQFCYIKTQEKQDKTSSVMIGDIITNKQ